MNSGTTPIIFVKSCPVTAQRATLPEVKLDFIDFVFCLVLMVGALYGFRMLVSDLIDELFNNIIF